MMRRQHRGRLRRLADVIEDALARTGDGACGSGNPISVRATTRCPTR
jgi:hypothetical protein